MNEDLFSTVFPNNGDLSKYVLFVGVLLESETKQMCLWTGIAPNAELGYSFYYLWWVMIENPSSFYFG